MGMLALIVATAIPALAQEAASGQGTVSGDQSNAPPDSGYDAVLGTIMDISGSVVLVEEDPSSDSGGKKGDFTVTDETEITRQEDGASVPAAFEDLEVGQSVEAIYAGPVMESYPSQGNAGSIAILEDSDPPPDECEAPSPDAEECDAETITATFELAVEGEPPAGTTFFGGASQQTVGLGDPDGDGTYTGSLTLPEGFYDLGPFPVPVAILTGTPEDPERVIQDFGAVVLEDGDVFSADVSYAGTEPPAPPDPEEPTDECLALSPNPEECEGYVAPVGSGGGSGSGGSAVVSGGSSNADKGGGVAPAPGVDLDEAGTIDDADGAVAAEVSASAGSSAAASITKVLPATGGILPIAGAAGTRLIVGGLLARRILR